jgi:hypothetical protein
MVQGIPTCDDDHLPIAGLIRPTPAPRPSPADPTRSRSAWRVAGGWTPPRRSTSHGAGRRGFPHPPASTRGAVGPRGPGALRSARNASTPRLMVDSREPLRLRTYDRTREGPLDGFSLDTRARTSRWAGSHGSRTPSRWSPPHSQAGGRRGGAQRAQTRLRGQLAERRGGGAARDQTHPEGAPIQPMNCDRFGNRSISCERQT